MTDVKIVIRLRRLVSEYTVPVLTLSWPLVEHSLFLHFMFNVHMDEVFAAFDLDEFLAVSFKLDAVRCTCSEVKLAGVFDMLVRGFLLDVRQGQVLFSGQIDSFIQTFDLLCLQERLHLSSHVFANFSFLFAHIVLHDDVDTLVEWYAVQVQSLGLKGMYALLGVET
jgi:hypothetical protein